MSGSNVIFNAVIILQFIYYWHIKPLFIKPITGQICANSPENLLPTNIQTCDNVGETSEAKSDKSANTKNSNNFDAKTVQKSCKEF